MTAETAETAETPEVWTARLNEARQRIEALAATLDHEQANTRPAPGKWSVAECIEHMNQSMKVYAPHMAKAVERGLAGGREGEPPFSRGTCYGAMLLWALRKDGTKRKKLKVPALPMFKPEKRTEWQMDDVVTRFRAGVEELLAHLQALKGRDLGKLKHGTPLPLLKVTLAQSMELHSRHNLRHTQQAERTAPADKKPPNQ